MRLQIRNHSKDRVALIDGNWQITYGELNRLAEQYAYGMAASKTDRFYLEGTSDADAVAITLGAYLSGKELLMIPAFLPGWIKRLVRFQYGFPANARLVKPAKAALGEGRIILSTSGTEGKPKQISPSNNLFTDSFESIISQTGVNAGSTVYSPAPFVAAPVPVLIALATGATVKLEPHRSDINNALDCDSIICIPSFAEKNYDSITRFTNVMCATQPFSANLNEKSKTDGLNIWDVYSSTETGIVGLRRASDSNVFSIPNNMHVEAMHQDAYGAGEIIASGAYVMEGTYKKASFVPNTGPVTNGDIVKVSGNELDLIARSNNSKIKVSGYAVYLPYIEQALWSLVPGGKVSVLQDEPNDVIIVTVPDSHRNAPVLEHLSNLLPWYMMPQRIEYGI